MLAFLVLLVFEALFNRFTRSHCEGSVATAAISNATLLEAEETLLKYERLMAAFEFHSVMNLLDEYIRAINKTLSDNMKLLQERNDVPAILQVLADAAHMIKPAMLMLHPIVPAGAELVREYLQIDERVWSWKYAFKPLSFFYPSKPHKFKFLEPRVDFFKKHESQF